MIILTGASGGIGKKLYQSFANIEPIIGIANSKIIDPLQRGISDNVDITDKKAVVELINSYRDIIDQVTLINMAVFSKDGLLANYPTDQFIETFSVNIFGNLNIVQALLPFMIEQKFGRIIHISSIVGQSGKIGAGAYAASKSSLVGYSQTLAKEYARFGVTSNILSLGYFEGGLSERLEKNVFKSTLESIPVKRLGGTKDILSAIKFLRECDYINGEVVNLHGGL